jgi:hypothetical protein
MIFAATILLNLVFVALYTTYLNDFNASDIVSNTYTTLRNQFHSPSNQQAQHKKNGPVYSWINKKANECIQPLDFRQMNPIAKEKSNGIEFFK